MTFHIQPTELEVRGRIESIGTDISCRDMKNVPNSHDDYQYQMAFKFQLMAAGRVSEVAGKYAPMGVDAYEVEFPIGTKRVDEEEIEIMEDAIMFVLKTAKRRGKLRACALPIDPKYEPWTKELYEYFEECGAKRPFQFDEKLDNSKSYAMNYAKAVFAGMEWPMAEYTVSVDKEFSEEQVLANRINDKNEEVWLVEIGDDDANWLRKNKDGTFKTTEKVPKRWKVFTSHALRKRRTITLKSFYKFDGFDLAAYGGWTEKSQVDALPGALKFYLEIDIQSSPDAFYILKDDLASTYFPKLLKTYDSLVKRDRKRLAVREKMFASRAELQGDVPQHWFDEDFL